MDKFKVSPNKRQSVVRSIRIEIELHKRLVIVSKASGVSYNKLITKCVEYALENL